MNLRACVKFDLMQEHLEEEMEKNAAYEKARTEMVSGFHMTFRHRSRQSRVT